MNNRSSKPSDADAGSENDPKNKLSKKHASGPTKTTPERGKAHKTHRAEAAEKTKRAGKIGGKPADLDEEPVHDEAAEQVKEVEQAEEVEKAKEVDEEIEALDEKAERIDDPEEIDRLKRKYMVRRFWQAARRFWTGQASFSAWLLTAGLLAVIVLNVAAAYAMNVWNRNIFDALESKNAGFVARLALIYVVILVVSVLFSVALIYVRMTLQRRWRKWLTDNLVDRWLKAGRYYQLNLVSGDHKNPEYRIADDVRIATEAPVDFVSGVTSAFLSAATFIVVLWTIGGSLDLGFIGLNMTIPGFLVVAAVLYAVFASGLMLVIGRRFIGVSERKNQTEAELRYLLTRLRENGESIAMIKGEEEERQGVDRALREVLRSWRSICFQTMKTTFVSSSSGFIAPVLPIILCAPKFLDGSMTLGQVMQAASAFTTVQIAFNWLVDNYPKLADWTASARRAASLMVSLDGLERAETGDGFGRIKITNEGESAAIRLRDLSVTLDDGTAVLEDTDIAIKPGERVLVAGESGTGKSTLVRAISGLWPWGGGEIERKHDAKLMFLPQRPYIPIGSLRRAATYPDSAESRPVKEIAEAFKHVGLSHLVDRIEDEAPWDQTLSGGEKQRLAFARIFLHNPDIVVLDEATAALDPKSQDQLMGLISKRPEETTLISVGHRPELEAFHSRKIVLERRRGPAKLVSDIKLVPSRQRQRFLRGWLGRRRAAHRAA
jgi:vitamin B12/bleomycin/antimicrobial peptide transport system ATP-binding/permease protein